MRGDEPTLETQRLIPRMRELFPECEIIHAIRHGNSVIGSNLAKGWYADEWLQGSVIDYVVGHINCKIPWYIPERIRDYWVKSNIHTRIAFVWAYLVRQALKYDDLFPVRYEDVISKPDEAIRSISEQFGLTPTGLTDAHRASIQRHPESAYPDFKPEIERICCSYYEKTLNMLYG